MVKKRDSVHEALGAGPPAGTETVTLFLPSVDRNGSPIDQKHWEDRTLEFFGRLFRGATAFPPGRGVWRDDSTGELVFDEPVLITSYVPAAVLYDDSTLAQLRAFVHELGRQTNQGEVGIVIDGEYHGITDYDPEH